MLQILWADVTALENDRLFAEVYADLSACRRAKVDRCVRRRDKNLCLCAGGLLDAVLRERGLREKNMIYAKGENGKPFFADFPALHFNISHSEDKVMVALSDREVGCDIEKIGEANFAIAHRFFTPREYALLMEISEPDARNEAFYRLWTLKESYLKQCGKGLSMPLDSFEIRREGENVFAFRGGIREVLVFAEWEPFPGYRAAVCTEEKIAPANIRCRCFDWASRSFAENEQERKILP